MITAAERIGLNPKYVQVGCVALQATGVVKKVRPRATSTPRPFLGPLKDAALGVKQLKFPNVTTQKKLFTIVSDPVYQQRLADSVVAKTKFVKDSAKDPKLVARLCAANISQIDIDKMKKGIRPSGFDVHHKEPLKFGGTNAQSNFMLMQKKGPAGPNFHGSMTNYQNQLSSGLSPGTTFETQWPTFTGIIYPY